MRLSLILILFVVVLPVLSQERATIRVEVKVGAVPVEGAAVRVNGVATLTDGSGVAVGSAALGDVEIGVSKEGFLPGKASLTVDAAREWQVDLELQRAEAVEEKITVYATRTDARLQDSATRVEVLGRDEIEEKMMMTPGDIVMMLNEMGGLRVQTTSPSLGRRAFAYKGCGGAIHGFSPMGCRFLDSRVAGLGCCRYHRWTWGRWR